MNARGWLLTAPGSLLTMSGFAGGSFAALRMTGVCGDWLLKIIAPAVNG